MSPERRKTLTVKKAACLIFGLFVVLTGYTRSDTAWVDYTDRRLSVDFQSVELETALRKIAREAGIVFSIDRGVEGRVTQRFQDSILENGIRRILADYNYIFLFDTSSGGEKRLRKVIVLRHGEENAAKPEAEETAVVRQETAAVVPLQPELGSQVVLERHRLGHYASPGTINDRPVEFLVDTGAATVVVSGELASEIGLIYGAARTVETANGHTTGYETILGRVALGELLRDEVQAIILPTMKTGRRVLLGMSFLKAFDLVQRDDVLIIRDPLSTY
jgi:clan AA aspartic protease, TIGR02281 family